MRIQWVSEPRFASTYRKQNKAEVTWDLQFCKRHLVCPSLAYHPSHYITQKQDNTVRAYIEVGFFKKKLNNGCILRHHRLTSLWVGVPLISDPDKLPTKSTFHTTARLLLFATVRVIYCTPTNLIVGVSTALLPF